MSNLKKRGATLLAAVILAAGAFSVTTPPASAAMWRLSQADYAQACKSQYGGAYEAQLQGNNAFSWKCVTFFWITKYLDVDMYCRRIGGTKAVLMDPGPYGWHCQR